MQHLAVAASWPAADRMSDGDDDEEEELDAEQTRELVDGMDEPDLREAAEELGLEVAAGTSVDALRAAVQAAYAPDKGEGGAAEEVAAAEEGEDDDDEEITLEQMLQMLAEMSAEEVVETFAEGELTVEGEATTEAMRAALAAEAAEVADAQEEAAEVAEAAPAQASAEAVAGSAAAADAADDGGGADQRLSVRVNQRRASVLSLHLMADARGWEQQLSRDDTEPQTPGGRLKFTAGGKSAKLPPDCTLEQLRIKFGLLLKCKPDAVALTYQDSDEEMEIVDDGDLDEAKAKASGGRVALGLVGGAASAAGGASPAPASPALATGGAVGRTSSEEYAAEQDVMLGAARNPLLSFEERLHCAYMCHTQDTGGA